MQVARLAVASPGMAVDHPALAAARADSRRPAWMLTVGQMVCTPTGSESAAAMLALAQQAIRQATESGEPRHASALQAIGRGVFARTTLGSAEATAALKDAFVKYAYQADNERKARSLARCLTAPGRQSDFFVVGDVVRTRFGAGRLLQHRVQNDICVVQLGYGIASVHRSELLPVLPEDAAAVPQLSARALANSHSMNVPALVPVAATPPSHPHHAHQMVASLAAMAGERPHGIPTALEHNLAQATAAQLAQAVVANGLPLRAEPKSLARLADHYRHRTAVSAGRAGVRGVIAGTAGVDAGGAAADARHPTRFRIIPGKHRMAAGDLSSALSPSSVSMSTTKKRAASSLSRIAHLDNQVMTAADLSPVPTRAPKRQRHA